MKRATRGTFWRKGWRFHWLTHDYVGPFRPWMQRPLCWWRGYHEPRHTDVYFEMCGVCLKSLWSRRRDGSPNPIRDVDRVPLRSRKAAA